MSWLDGLRYIAASALGRRRLARERDEELEFHVQMEADQLGTEGLTPSRARVVAAMRLGPPHRPEPRRWRLETLRHDLRHAARTLARSPSYTTTTVVTLSVALSIAVVALAVVDAVIFRPLPLPHDAELMVLSQTSSQRPEGFPVSLPNFTDWRARSRTFAAMAAWTDAVQVVTGPDFEARSAEVAAVTADFFSLLSVRPLLGRAIGSGDGVTGAPPAIVISHRFWLETFRGDPHVVGRQVRIGPQTATIVGVMPAAFRYPAATEVWREYPAELMPLMPRNTIIFSVLARRRAQFTADQASRELAAIAGQLHAEYPSLRDNQATGARAIPLRDALFNADRPMILLLGCTMLFALVVACLNLACANLARTVRRQGDFIIREALGASRLRQWQYWIVEAALVSGVSGVLALTAAPFLIRSLAARPEFLALQVAQPSLDGRSVAATCVLALLITALIGWWPAWRISRRARRGRLHVTAPSAPLRTMASLITLEIAMAVVLMIGAVLAVRTAVKILAQPRGFDGANVLTVDLRLPSLGTAGTVRLLDQMLDSVRALPGVVSAGMVNALPLTADPGRKARNSTGIKVMDAAVPADSTGGAGFHAVSGDYFAALRLPLLQGRLIVPADDSAAPRVTVISQSMANRYWPNTNPLGKQFIAIGADPGLFNQPLTVVGVVGDIRASSLEEAELPDYYTADRQGIVGVWKWYLVIRTSNPPARLIPAVRRQLQAAERRTALSFATMDDRIATSMARRLIAGTALGAVAAASLFLVLIGIYGIISFSVASRRREIGVRLALGATRARVHVDMFRSMLLPLTVGPAAGIVAAILLGHVMQQFVFDLSPRDPATFAGAVALVVVAAAVAAIVPARRAAGVDPMIALRDG
jgi:predicted permease